MEDKKKTTYYKVKFIVVGNQAVGKTNLIHCFATGDFKADYAITLGIDYLTSKVQIDNKNFQLELWDTAGSEKFRSITKGYYKNSTCAIIVYDITEEKSFQDVILWLEDCKKYTNKNIQLILVGNKIDLNFNRVITTEQGKQLADDNGMSFYETSALKGININDVFIDACKIISKNIDEGKYDLDDDSFGLRKCTTLNKYKFDKKDLDSNDNSSKKKLEKDIPKKKPKFHC